MKRSPGRLALAEPIRATGEHKPLVHVPATELELVRRLGGLVRLEDFDGVGIEVDHAWLAALRERFPHDLPAYRSDRLAGDDEPLVEPWAHEDTTTVALTAKAKTAGNERD